jgi:hypothetical protein
MIISNCPQLFLTEYQSLKSYAKVILYLYLLFNFSQSHNICFYLHTYYLTFEKQLFLYKNKRIYLQILVQVQPMSNKILHLN